MDNANSGIYRRVLSGFAWQGATKFVVQALSWISTVLVARLLDPSDYGIMAIAGVFLGLMMMLMEMGLAQALVQKSAITRQDEDAVFWLGLLLGGVLFLAMFLLAPLIASFYDIPLLGDVLRVAAAGLIISSLKAVPQALILRKLDFRARALIEMGATFASIVTVISLAFAGFGVWSLVWGMLVQQSIVTLGFLPALGHLPGFNWRFAEIAPVVRYGLHITGSNLAFQISNRADVFIIGKFLGEHLTGIYSLALQLATIPLDKVGTVFNQVAFPSLSRLKDDERQCRSLFLDLHRYLIFIAYPILVGLALVAEDMVGVLLGEKWLLAVPILQVVCAVNVMRVSGMLISPALNSRGRAREAMIYSMTGAVLLPLAYLAGAQFGLRGVALAWVAAYPLLYAMLLRYLHRDLGITLGDLINGSRPALIATVVMGSAVLVVQVLAAELNPVVRLLASVGAGALAYAGVFLVFYGEQVDRMRRALRTLRSGSSA